jgi:hypothetical protein
VLLRESAAGHAGSDCIADAFAVHLISIVFVCSEICQPVL